MLQMLQIKILSLEEIRRVLDEMDTQREAVRGKGVMAANAWLSLIIFRLSTCCGLRCKEIRHITLRDLHLSGPRPYIHIRPECTKRSARTGKGRERRVPLWWDRSTLEDLKDWHTWRKSAQGLDEPACRSTDPRASAPIMPRRRMESRFKNTIKCLGPERHADLSIHSGRHSFVSHALHSGRSLAEVRDAAGHAWATTTEIYLHALDSGVLPDIFPEDEDEEI